MSNQIKLFASSQKYKLTIWKLEIKYKCKGFPVYSIGSIV